MYDLVCREPEGRGSYGGGRERSDSRPDLRKAGNWVQGIYMTQYLFFLLWSNSGSLG